MIRLPGVVDVTSTDIVQEPGVEPTWAATVPPLKEMVVVPVLAMTMPPHVLSRFEGVAILKPACRPTRLSVKETLSSWKVFGLKMLISSREVSPAMMEIGVNRLLIWAENESAWTRDNGLRIRIPNRIPNKIRDLDNLFILLIDLSLRLGGLKR